MPLERGRIRSSGPSRPRAKCILRGPPALATHFSSCARSSARRRKLLARSPLALASRGARVFSRFFFPEGKYRRERPRSWASLPRNPGAGELREADASVAKASQIRVWMPKDYRCSRPTMVVRGAVRQPHAREISPTERSNCSVRVCAFGWRMETWWRFERGVHVGLRALVCRILNGCARMLGKHCVQFPPATSPIGCRWVKLVCVSLRCGAL